MASFKLLSRFHARAAVRAAYVVAVAGFLWAVALFYIPGKGFTAFVMFGEDESARYIPELRATDFYLIPESGGYDAQWYAQIAMHPNLGDPELRDALDGLPYRARRILFCWSAFALAGGDPVRALHLYAVQNIACWLALAALLCRWFPATSWNNFARWGGILFSFGMCFSVRGALVDGPSLLLIALGVALLEKGRPWWSALMLGVAGLAKETNILAAGAVGLPRDGESGKWLRAVGRMALAALPLAVWLVVLQVWIGGSGDPGQGNFAWPFAGLVKKARDIVALAGDPAAAGLVPGTIVVTVALMTQWCFLVLRPQWRKAWWRVGAAYAVLLVFLGPAVWEGYPGAASRVLLPMALAFNVLVPRTRRWIAVLVLGNLSFILVPSTMGPPILDREELRGPAQWRRADDGSAAVQVVFDAAWYAPEGTQRERWRWSGGPATLTIRNRHAFALMADVEFAWWTTSARTVRVLEGNRELWSGRLEVREHVPVSLRGVRLPPGDTVWRIETDAAPAEPVGSDPRRLAFSVRDFTVRLTGKAE